MQVGRQLMPPVQGIIMTKDQTAIIVYQCLLNNGGDDEGTENCRTPII